MQTQSIALGRRSQDPGGTEGGQVSMEPMPGVRHPEDIVPHASPEASYQSHVVSAAAAASRGGGGWMLPTLHAFS